MRFRPPPAVLESEFHILLIPYPEREFLSFLTVDN